MAELLEPAAIAALALAPLWVLCELTRQLTRRD